MNSFWMLMMPFLIPFITEVVKFGMGKVLPKVPPKAVPLLATVLGAASSVIPGSPVADPAIGALIGASGVAVHQTFTPPKNVS